MLSLSIEQITFATPLTRHRTRWRGDVYPRILERAAGQLGNRNGGGTHRDLCDEGPWTPSIKSTKNVIFCKQGGALCVNSRANEAAWQRYLQL
eukprot:1178741-Prorocentrum_minimum.AAC.5